MANTNQKKGGGSRKIGRNKRAKNQNLSLYVKGKISFEKYFKNSK